MESRLLLNVIVAQRPAIFELLSGKDEALLVWGDSLLVLDLGLYIVDCVRRFHLESDRLPCKAEGVHLVSNATLGPGSTHVYKSTSNVKSG